MEPNELALNPDGLAARVLAPAWLLACVVLGGSSSGGLIANGLLQIVAGGLIVWLVHRGALVGLDRSSRVLLGIFGLTVAVALLTLIPLPPSLWRLIPGRAEVFDAYSLIRMAQPWLPVSLMPDATIAVLLSLLPPLAMFLLVLGSSPSGRQITIVTLAAAAIVSVLFGVTQQAAGYRSDLYIYQLTSRGGAVGFFANRNHLATLCLVVLPLLATLAAAGRRARSGTRVGSWTLPAGALLLLAVGALVVQSLAGWFLLAPTLLVCALLFWKGGRREPSGMVLTGVAIIVAFAIVAALFAPVSPADFGQVVSDVNPQERRQIMGLTWRAAVDFLPFGSGLGSFDQIYPKYESPATIAGTFINHAHNDYLELLLEFGVFGAALLAAFLYWWAGRLREAWAAGGDPIARAACVSIGVILAHSFVDYPVRTAAVASVAALCCGLATVRTRISDQRRSGRERSTGTIMLGAEARPAKLRDGARLRRDAA